MAHEKQGRSRARPLRIAFLVSDGEHSALALDGIFADCYNRWGGRFSLVVPCINSKIAAEYWPWLEAYDPDIVYSYVSLSKPDVLEVHERLCPGQYIVHKLGHEPRLDVYGFKPDYRFAPLSSLSTIFKWARHVTTPARIIDSWYTETAIFVSDRQLRNVHSQP